MKIFKAHQKLRAFTLIELMVVIVILAVLVTLVVTAVLRSRAQSRTACCNCNLKQIGLSFRTWSIDQKDLYPMRALTNLDGTLEMSRGTNAFRAFQAMSNEVNNPLILVCPNDSRSPATDFVKFSNANLSYFVGLDTDETMPAMWLSGDRNLATNGTAVVPGLVTLTSAIKVTWAIKMHYSYGNVGLSDGSVQEVSSTNLQMLLVRTGTNVNRLAIP